VEYLNLFPTPLRTSVELDLRNELLPTVEHYINTHGVPYRGQSGYISTFNVATALLEQDNDLRLNPLTDYITAATRKYFEDVSLDYSTAELKLYYLFNKMTFGGEHPVHAHPGSLLSGVFYIKVPQGAPPIVFRDPRSYYNHTQYPVRFGNPRDMYKIFPEYVLHPVDGLMLMWPSWLEHQVPPSKCAEERIAISFNVLL